LGGELLDAMGRYERAILIIDAADFDLESFGKGTELKEAIRCQRCDPVLFNVNLDEAIEYEAISNGIRGIFYSSEPIEHLCKGLDSLLAGELWFPRKVLSDFIKTITRRKMANGLDDSPLTKREREILIRLAGGASKQEIADHYNISPHTVKTHIHNCYKKIGVSNRMQASVWAQQHL
jgi:LuxR family transcriptional regulator of csgAB operon